LSIEQLKTAGMLLFGRVTCEGMAVAWASAKGEAAERMISLPKIAFSATMDKADWANTRLVKENAAKEIERRKREPGTDLFIFGSGKLVSSLTPLGLIDEHRIGVVPIMLGSGNPLLNPNAGRADLKLLEAKPLKSGFAILRYGPVREPYRRRGERSRALSAGSVEVL
jgi:dihydrofolate reductase